MSCVLTDPSSAIRPALVKLIEAVEEESEALRDQRIISHAGYTDRKNQALRELMVAQRRGTTAHSPRDLEPLLSRLSRALETNARLLKHHIAAVGEVSDIIVAGLRSAESDGTYSRENNPFRRR